MTEYEEEYDAFIEDLSDSINKETVMLLNIKSDNHKIKTHCEMYFRILKDKDYIHEVICGYLDDI